MDAEIFVQNIKRLCQRKGVSPTKACEDSGAGRNFVGDINNGKIPSVERTRLLAEYLSVTTSELLGEATPIYQARDRPIDPLTQEAMGIFEDSSVYQRRRMLEMMKMYKGWEESALEAKKKSSPAESEAADSEPERYYEGDEPVEEGAYMCSGCKKTIIRIKKSGEKLGACPACNNIYWTMT